MSRSPSELEAQLTLLIDSVRKLEERVATLERTGAAARGRRVAAAPDAGTAARARSDALAVAAMAPLVGRTLLVLAGAFVLRALTDAGTLPAWLGVVLGLAYAGTWLALSDRAAGKGAAASAGFHAFAAAAIGFPLLFEASSRFRLLPPVAAAALLAALTAGALWVAARRRLQGLAWIAAMGCAATAVALAAASGRAAPAALTLVLLGAATLWLGYVLDWFALRWPVAVVADLIALVLALGAGRSPDSAPAALLVLGALVAAYLGSIAARTLLLGRRVVPFEVVQAIAAIAVGLGGAAHVTARAGMGSGAVGAVSLLFGAACYAVAFAFLERREQARANFYFYSSAALVFALVGGASLLPRAALGIACAALAVIAGALARSRGRLTLAVHGAIYALAASLASGLAGGATAALLAAPAALSAGLGPGTALVLAAAAFTAWLTAAAPERVRPEEHVAQLALVASLAWAAAGAAVGLLAPLAGAADPGAVASLRTAVLAATALALAALGRSGAWVEARWLAYPLLGVVGLKMLLEDLPRGRPASLFLSFAAYGAVLLLVPRLRRRTAGGAGAAS